MTVSEQELTDVVTAVLTDMLGVPIMPLIGADSNGTGPQITGCIHVSGGWEGSVLVEMTQRVARELAAGMFDEAAADVADADVMDALGEVANMIGGNVKALLGATSLSLPSVTSGDRFVVHVPGSRLETTSAFECLGDPARVLLLTSQA